MAVATTLRRRDVEIRKSSGGHDGPTLGADARGEVAQAITCQSRSRVQCFGCRTSVSQPDGAATGMIFMNASTPWICPP